MMSPEDYPDEADLDRQFHAAQRLLPELVEEEPPITQTPQMKGYAKETPDEVREQEAARKEREGRVRAANALTAETVSPLPVFTPTPACPKCGCEELRWMFGHHTEAPAREDRLFGRVGFQPYISLECRRCAYGSRSECVWVMAPKEAP